MAKTPRERPAKLRRYSEDLPLREPTTTLIMVAGDVQYFACGVQEKKELLVEYQQQVDNNPALIAVWPGRYSSHAFAITAEQALAHLDKPAKEP